MTEIVQPAGGGSGGGTFAVETPSGTINGVNTVFTVLNTPIYISVDGVNKFETVNYTYSLFTIIITDGAPPSISIQAFVQT